MTDLLTIDWDDDAPVATKPKIQLRGPQPGWVDAIEADLKTHTRLLAVAPGGIGKCLGRGTPVMRFDGRIVHVEDIRVGDLLMGPDSMPRRVASTCYGIDELYRIEPVKGDPYVVTKDHVLSLKLTGNRPIHHMGEKHIGHGKIVNTKVSDLLATTNNFRHCTNGWRTGVDFQPTELHPLIPPYMLGLWLGDGSADSFSISKPDPEVLKSVNDYADSIGHRVRSTKGKCPTHNVISPEDAIRGRGLRPNQATNALRDLGLLSGKHIPHAYKTASRADRLELLAGILDSDGHMCKGCSCYDYITKDIALCEDVAFVARSLGFAAYYKPCRKGCQNGFVGDYFRMSISGDVSELPMRIPRKKSPPRTQKKSVLVTGIEAVPVGEGEYFGFQLDGPDGLFLLGDFTVTHNSTVFAFLAARMWARGIRTLVLENRDRLTRQTAKRLADETGLQVEIEMGDEHASPFAPIVVACVQSLGRTNRLTGFADDHFGMVVADECVPGSTTVGDKTISTIIPGDLVPSMNHSTGLIERRKVIATSVRSTNRLIKITSHGRRLYCTPNHPVYTERGYIEAKDVQVFDKISIRRTGMRNVRNASFEERAFSRDKKAEVLAVLRKVQRVEGDSFDSRVQALRKTSAVQGKEGVVHELGCGEVQPGLLLERVCKEMEGGERACVSRRKDAGTWACKGVIGAHEESESDEISGRSPAGRCKAQRQDIHRERWKWKADETARGTGVGLGRGSNGARDTDRHGDGPISVATPVLQGGRCNTRCEAGNRGGWEQSLIQEMEVSGSPENGDTEFSGVDCVEVLERGGGVEFGEVCPDGLVYNLEVEGNNNYFANGILVHNCHLSLANQWQRILNYFHYGAASLEEEWSAPPDGTYQPKASVVGFTASPDIGDRKNLGQFYQKRSVDYTYLEAVGDGWLVGIRQTSIPVKIDLKKYKARSTPTGMDFSTNDLSAAMVPIIEELAEQHAKHARDKKSIAFLPSVECARMMTDALIRRGIKSMFVSGECFDGDEKTEDFVRSGPGTTLCNAMIYTYGVDFPDVDCIGWYRATVSKAFYCLDEQTEVLTRDGWRRDVDVGQLVAAFDKDSGSISYVPALAKIRRPLEAGEHFFSIKSRSCDIRVTSKHRMLYDHKKRTGWKFVDAERLAEIRDTSYLPASGIGVEQAGVPLTDHELSFIGWVMTDGCISKQHKQIAITQASHQPWIGEIEKCIRGCGFKFTRRERWVASQFNRNSTTVIWTISFGRPRSTDKHLTGWGRLDKWLSKELAEPLMRMSPRQFDVFINAVHLGDGSKFKTANYVRHAYHITTGSRIFADRLQALALSCGYKCGVSEIHELGRTKLVVRMKKSPFHRVGGKSGDRPQWVSESACRGEQCWCVENALGTLVVRRNGKAIIVGNCQGIYRGTRVLPGTIDGLSTAEERRAAIARSRKTILTVMDPLFVSDRIDLMEPYDLFTDKPEVKKQMKEKGELNPESAREGERDFIKALEKAAKKNAHKAARTIDPVAFALNIGDGALAHYEPQTDREAAPMTVGQREYLQRNRIDISKVTCHGHAQKLIGRHLQRLQLKLATAEQLAFLKQLGFNEADTVKMSIREASAAIDARVKRR